MNISPAAIKERLLQKHKAGKPLQLLHVTCELLEQPAALGNADLLLLDHSSASRGFHPAAELLPLGNANEKLLQNAEAFRDLVRRYPTIAGVCATDPFRIPEKLLQQLKRLGFVGVQNWPSIGLIDGKFRMHLENSKISYEQEVSMLKMAKNLDLLTIGTVFSEANAESMKQAGADILLVHPGAKGLTPDYSQPATGDPLFIKLAREMSPHEDIIVLPWKRQGASERAISSARPLN